MYRTTLPAELVTLFNSVGILEPPVIDYLQEHIQPVMLSRKEFVIKHGEVCRNIFFVEAGFLRSYYDGGGKEVTNWFMQENQLVISVRSFFTQTPAVEFIQAIEACKVWKLRYEHYRYLTEHYHSFCTIGLRLTENYYLLSEERLQIMRQGEAEARFRFLLQIHPDILNRAPLGQIASYLGITQETLSRLRAKRLF